MNISCVYRIPGRELLGMRNIYSRMAFINNIFVNDIKDLI